MTNQFKLSYITHFYNNLQQARRVAAILRQVPSQTIEQFEIVIVDDGSAVPGCIDFGDLNVKYVRITEDIPWNQAGARNLAFSLSAGGYLFFTDIDHVLPSEGIRDLLERMPNLDPNTMYRFARVPVGKMDPIHSHVNTFLVQRDRFESIGGYDLEFTRSYGHEDTFLEWSWRQRGGSLIELPTIVHLFEGQATKNLSRDATENTILLEKKRNDGCVLGSPPRLPAARWVSAKLTRDGWGFD